MRFATPDEAYVQLSNGGTLMSKFCNLLVSFYNEDNKIAEVKSNEEVIESIRAAEERKQKAAKQQKKRQSSNNEAGIVVLSAEGMDNLSVR